MKRGFTLVEMLVAVTLLSLLLNGVFFSVSTALRSWQKISRQAAARQVRLIVGERLCADLRGAALLPASNSAEAVMQIGPDQVVYKLEAGKVKRNSAYLTSAGEIGSLSFSYPGGRLVGVRLDGLTFEAAARNG